MSKTYITDITHFLLESGEVAQMPAPARKLASFLALLIDATRRAWLKRSNSSFNGAAADQPRKCHSAAQPPTAGALLQWGRG